jgi:hypothetical protein
MQGWLLLKNCLRNRKSYKHEAVSKVFVVKETMQTFETASAL